MDYTPKAVIRALESLSQENNLNKRQQLLHAGLNEMVYVSSKDHHTEKDSTAQTNFEFHE
jgi:hypothetical protein